jgi:hypothetical protein
MDWVKWVIPLIAVAVWILSNLVNQQKEEPPVRRPRVPPPPRPREPVDPQAANSTTRPESQDAYRQEMDRQREKKSREPVAKQRPKRLEPVPKLPPKLPPRRVVLPPVLALPVPTQPLERSKPPEPPILLAPVSPIIPLLPPILGVVAPTVSAAKPTPPAIKNMLELLKKHDNLATAFLLKEVFDLPLAKRSRRRL